jgi:hypothetical protein
VFLIAPPSDQNRLISPFSSQLDQSSFQVKAERKPQYSSHYCGFYQITTRPPRVVIFCAGFNAKPDDALRPHRGAQVRKSQDQRFPQSSV